MFKDPANSITHTSTLSRDKDEQEKANYAAGLLLVWLFPLARSTFACQYPFGIKKSDAGV